MRLTELSLERYGAFAERTLRIPDRAGLTIIYGPNEAGKSTCLAALSDFLFGIPERTAYATLFGYDGMRLGATLVDAAGTELTLRRRRGRGRTLTDDSGTPVDDSVIARLLGATTRERFSTLFGLNHETLRSGGARLLAADGDIGRLIVEAGGGLRSLMARLDAMGAEADRLFASRRSADRAFYKALDAFDAADRDVKDHTVSRDAYEQVRKAAGAAQAKLAEARAEKQRVAAEMSELDRLVRAVPHMLELDRLLIALHEYVDIDALPDDFDVRVIDAIRLRDDTVGKAATAREKRNRLAARLDVLTASDAFISAETQVRDLAEQAVHIRKARGDRPNRLKDIETAETGLATLRRMLHLPADGDLSARLPSQAALDRVQQLATEAIERGVATSAARERAAELTDRLETLQLRVDAATAAGFAQPAAYSASQFSSLVAQTTAIAALRRQSDQSIVTARSAIEVLGFSTSEAMIAFVVPTADAIQAESEAREDLDEALARQVQQKVETDARARTANDAIEQLEATGTIASDVALAEARTARTEAWSPIHDAYLGDDVPADATARRTGIDAFEKHMRSADDLSDRRADEADRAANLTLARQQLNASTIASDACAVLIGDIKARLAQRYLVFAQAFPDATTRYPELAGLLDYVERRAQAIEALADAKRLACEAERLESELAPLRSLFESARQSVKIPVDDAHGFAAEVQLLCVALSRQETEHAEYRRDVRDVEALKPTVTRADREVADLFEARNRWQDQWAAALKALGLDLDLPPDRAGSLVSEWSAARATLGTIEQTRTRLDRMDQDEVALKSAAITLGSKLGMALPEDPLAATDQIAAHWQEQDGIRLQRAALLPDLEEAKGELSRLEEVEVETNAAVAALVAFAGMEGDGNDLLRVAERCVSRRAMKQDRAQVERSIADVSDGLSIAQLRDQWAERDLDALRGALSTANERSTQLEGDVEAAILAQKAAQDSLERFAAESGINLAIAERESAAARMQDAVERYVELTVARELITVAIDRIRSEQQDPLVARAGELFAFTTRGEYSGIGTDIDDKGLPVVIGRRQSGSTVSVSSMSDGTRDQLFLAFRLASLENYASSTEPLPFVADDILVHFDDDRSAATLDLLSRFAENNQVLLFTHHKSVRDDGRRLEALGSAAVVEIERA